MDEELLKKIGLAAGGVLVGALGYHLLSDGNEVVYTGLTREYADEAGKKIAAAVWADSQGYEIRFEAKRDGVLINPFPDFHSPIFIAPFAAALYADDIGADLGFAPSGPWAKNTNEAAAMRELERKA